MFCLNIRHSIQNLDELRTIIEKDHCPDILGFETFRQILFSMIKWLLAGMGYCRKICQLYKIRVAEGLIYTIESL